MIYAVLTKMVRTVCYWIEFDEHILAERNIVDSLTDNRDCVMFMPVLYIPV